VTVERSRQLGRLLMALSGGGLLAFLLGVARRSYLALAIPVALGAGGLAGLGLWVGYTMATTRWENDDFSELELMDEAEGAQFPGPGGE
jgi:hypothetical protein